MCTLIGSAIYPQPPRTDGGALLISNTCRQHHHLTLSGIGRSISGSVLQTIAALWQRTFELRALPNAAFGIAGSWTWIGSLLETASFTLSDILQGVKICDPLPSGALSLRWTFIKQPQLDLPLEEIVQKFCAVLDPIRCLRLEQPLILVATTPIAQTATPTEPDQRMRDACWQRDLATQEYTCGRRE